MKLRQLIECNKKNILFQNYAKTEAGETSSKPLIFKKKPNMR